MPPPLPCPPTQAGDDYSYIMAEALADRLAEAYAEKLHELVRHTTRLHVHAHTHIIRIIHLYASTAKNSQSIFFSFFFHPSHSAPHHLSPPHRCITHTPTHLPRPFASSCTAAPPPSPSHTTLHTLQPSPSPLPAWPSSAPHTTPLLPGHTSNTLTPARLAGLRTPHHTPPAGCLACPHPPPAAPVYLLLD